jgi:hypothetical protein
MHLSTPDPYSGPCDPNLTLTYGPCDPIPNLYPLLGTIHPFTCLVRAYGDGNRLSPNRLDSQVHAHRSRNLRAIEKEIYGI